MTSSGKAEETRLSKVFSFCGKSGVSLQPLLPLVPPLLRLSELYVNSSQRPMTTWIELLSYRSSAEYVRYVFSVVPAAGSILGFLAVVTFLPATMRCRKVGKLRGN